VGIYPDGEYYYTEYIVIHDEDIDWLMHNSSLYKVVQIWPGMFTLVYTQISPGHIWTKLYFRKGLWYVWRGCLCHTKKGSDLDSA